MKINLTKLLNIEGQVRHIDIIDTVTETTDKRSEICYDTCVIADAYSFELEDVNV